MKLIKHILTAVFILTIQLNATAQNDSVNYDVKFNDVVKEAYSKDVFSGNALIVRDGTVIFESSVGYSDYGKNIPNNSDTKFETGSITKFFVKTLVHQLSEKNLISLMDNIGKYLPGFSPEISENVTIQELLDHTSGLGDFLREDLNPYEINSIKSISDVLPLIKKEKLIFSPGSKVQYSNSGYVVLAAMVEKIYGKSLGVILKENIFDKTGMNNSGFSIRVTEAQGKAKGYLSAQIGAKQDNSDMDLIGAGAGGIYSTAGDLNRFAQSLIRDNRLLSDESKVKLFNSPLFPVQYKDWNEFLKSGRFAIAGGAPGISSVLGINMEKDFVIVVLSNYDEGTAEEVFQRLSSLLNGRDAEPFSPPPARVIYDIIKTKGAENFISNYKYELSLAGISLDNDMILLFAGREFLRENDAENAIALYSVYTKEFPDIVVAWNDLGDAYLMKNEKDKARKCFEQALKLRPENKRARDSIIKIG